MRNCSAQANDGKNKICKSNLNTMLYPSCMLPNHKKIVVSKILHHDNNFWYIQERGN